MYWDDFTKAATLGPDLLLQMIEQVKLIRDIMKAAQDRQNSYVDLKCCPEDFEVGNRVLLRVSSMRGVVRFGARGKLRPIFIGLYEIIECVGKMANRVDYSNSLEKAHDVFHVLQWK